MCAGAAASDCRNKAQLLGVLCFKWQIWLGPEPYSTEVLWSVYLVDYFLCCPVGETQCTTPLPLLLSYCNRIFSSSQNPQPTRDEVKLTALYCFWLANSGIRSHALWCPAARSWSQNFRTSFRRGERETEERRRAVEAPGHEWAPGEGRPNPAWKDGAHSARTAGTGHHEGRVTFRMGLSPRWKHNELVSSIPSFTELYQKCLVLGPSFDLP